MNNKFQKAKPTISLSEFLSKANNVSLFSSSTGKVYDVLGIEDNEMIFIRMSANQSINWRMNLMEVYKAYINLEDFATSNFKHTFIGINPC